MIARTHTCTQSFGTSSGQARRALKARALAFARHSWRAYWHRRARRATVLILHSLDERTLHDIGINPSEIESCVYGSGGDRRRRYHEAWPWRSTG